MRFSVFLVVLGCQEFSLVDDGNDPPLVDIVSHGPGDVFVDGDDVTFRAVPSDEDDVLERLSVGWWIDEQVLCDLAAPDADGNSLCTGTVVTGMQTLRVEVRDAANAMGFDTLDLAVRAPNVGPECAIVAPPDASSVGLFRPAMRVLWWHLPCEHRWKSTFVALKQPVISSPLVPESVR